MSVKVEGLKELQRAFRKAGVSAQDQKELMYELGMIVVRAANPPTVSGALEGSIRSGKAKSKAVVRAGGARVPYAGPIHYGWPKRNIKPQPFLQQAIDSRENELVARIDKGVDEILRKNNL